MTFFSGEVLKFWGIFNLSNVCCTLKKRWIKDWKKLVGQLVMKVNLELHGGTLTFKNVE
jgi:hypothetical protein